MENEVDIYFNEAYAYQNYKTIKVSSFFKYQLYAFEKIGVHRIYIQNALIDIDNDVLQSKGMKIDTQFRNEPLKGLWKKHIYDHSFEAVNIKNELKDENSATYKQIVELFKKHEGEFFPVIQNELINIIVVESVNNRRDNNKFTGEWIIYANQNEKKYILTFANHREGITQKDGDNKIHSRITKYCKGEFPFLFMETEGST